MAIALDEPLQADGVLEHLVNELFSLDHFPIEVLSLLKKCFLLGSELVQCLPLSILPLKLSLTGKLIALVGRGTGALERHRIRQDLVINERVGLVVHDVVLVLVDHVHGREDVEGVVDTPLHVFELNLVTEGSIELKDLVSNFRTGGHRVFPNTLQN